MRERQGPDRNLSFSDVINHPFSPDFKCVGFFLTKKVYYELDQSMKDINEVAPE